MAFPATILVDNFTREGFESEAPGLSLGGLWKALFEREVLTIVGGVATKGSNFSAGKGAAMSLNVEPTAQAIQMKMTKNTGNSERTFQLLCCLSSPGTSSINGYRALFEEEGAGSGKFKIFIHKITAGAYSELAKVETISIAANDLIGLNVEGGKVTAWSGTGTLTARVEVSDSTYTSGVCGYGQNGTESRLTELKLGGALKVPTVPSLSIVDNLKRTENPLSNGGAWKRTETQSHEGDLRATETGVNSAEGFNAENHGNNMYWSSAEYEHGFVAIASAVRGSAKYFNLWLHLTVSGAKRKAETGYRAQAEWTPSAGLKVNVFKLTGGTEASVGEVAGCPDNLSTTAQTAISQQGGKLIVWVKPHEAMPWLPAKEFTESTYTKGFSGLGENGEAQRNVNFATGAIGEEVTATGLLPMLV